MYETILVIEDDHSIEKFLRLSLETNHYKVIHASTGIEGISLFMSDNPNLILLDLGLPDIDGMEVLNVIREKNDVPIIVVSARELENEKIKALDQGADDYITKPFSINELLARVRVALRKTTSNVKKKESFSVRDFKIDFEKHKVYVKNVEIHVTPIEYKLLELLVEHAGKVLTHRYIIEKIWGYANSEDSQSLRVFMANIRRKIETDASQPHYIITEVGVGYRFTEE